MAFVLSRLVIALAGVALLFGVPHAHACTPISPEWSGESPHSFVIVDEPGRYCLEGTMLVPLSDMNGIAVTANDVVLDLGGSAIIGPQRGSGVGVHILAGNVVVIGGNVSGFRYGVWAFDSPDLYISRIDASGNIAGGIVVDGDSAVVELSRVSRLQASTRGEAVKNPVGIRVSGNDCHVRYNAVTDVFAPEGRVPGRDIFVNGEDCQVYENVAKVTAVAPEGTVPFVAGPEAPKSVHQNLFVSELER